VICSEKDSSGKGFYADLEEFIPIYLVHYLLGLPRLEGRFSEVVLLVQVLPTPVQKTKPQW